MWPFKHQELPKIAALSTPAKAVEINMSILKKIGHVLLTVVTFGATAAQDAAPFVSIFNSAWGALLGSTSSAILTAEAAGTTAATAAPASDTSAQKLAIVLAAIKPQALEFAKTVGATEPTDAQITTYVNGIVAALNAFQIPAAA